MPSSLPAGDYLEALQTLAQEIDRAMTAIVERALPQLEESVCRQLAICAKLSAAPGFAPASTYPADTILEERIYAATANLVILNKNYSALIKHSGDTVRLFAGLFRSYTGPVQQGSESRSNHHTWSCEL